MHQYQVKVSLAVHPRLAKPDPPLNLNAPKPTFTNAKQDSAFGFKSRVPSDIASDSDIAPDSDAEMLSAQERLAEEIFNHNNNLNGDVGERHSILVYLIIPPLKYLLPDYCDDIYVNGLSSFTSYITRLIQIRTVD